MSPGLDRRRDTYRVWKSESPVVIDVVVVSSTLRPLLRPILSDTRFGTSYPENP